MTIGERIYKHRKQAGLSQEELADKMNVTRQSISLWETDQTTPSLDSLILLAEIFAVSLDELCGTRSVQPEETVKPPCAAETSEHLAYAETKYTIDLVNFIYKLSAKKFFIISIVAIICSIVTGIGVILSNTDNMFLIIPVFFIAIFSAYPIRLHVSFKKRVAEFVKNRSNCVAKIKFYQDRFDLVMTSDNSESKSTVQFCDIKKVKNTEKYILIYLDHKIVAIEKNIPGTNYDLILKLLNVPCVSAIAHQNKKIKVFLLIMFIVSLLSIFMALMAVAIADECSPLPEFPHSMLGNMWIFLAFIPLPLASAVLGIVFYIKKYKCKKNIIAGFIMCTLLAIYGSFTFAFKDFTKHDFQYVQELEQAISIDLPNSGYISRSINVDGKTNSIAMIKFVDGNAVYNTVDSDMRFSRDADLAENNVPAQYETITKDYDYFMLFDVTCGYTVTSGHEKHRLIYVAYSIEKNILLVLDFVK